MRFLSTASSSRPATCAGAMRLLMAALVRDFWVVEKREDVFGVRRVARSPVRTRREHKGPTIVYLPRVRYSPMADLERCEKALGQSSRRAHHVAGHLRRAARASPRQLVMARSVGVHVPDGFTFVRPHERGQGERDVVYRSRSALESLYTPASGPGPAVTPSDWFIFERNARKAIEAMGARVVHVAAPGADQDGVDMYAITSSKADAASLFRCLPGNDRKVRPTAIRELARTLRSYPGGVRGVLMIEGVFTSACHALAREHDITLVAGERFRDTLV
jgi:hypothetical protein